MQEYARNALYLLLSSLANPKPPSWCIEKQVYGMIEGQPSLQTEVGTVEVLNVLYRNSTILTGTDIILPDSFSTQFGQPTSVGVFGLKWSSASVPVVYEVSDDGTIWTQVGAETRTVASGWLWSDIIPSRSAIFFRVRVPTGTINASVSARATVGSEITLGELNRDNYVNQSNKVFKGRPNSCWIQRGRLNPIINLWPAPDAASELNQIVIWRNRHIMDVGRLAQEIEVPQRWLDAITELLASKMAQETPAVQFDLLPILERRAAQLMQVAWDGDNDGSGTMIQPMIGCYTA